MRTSNAPAPMARQEGFSGPRRLRLSSKTLRLPAWARENLEHSFPFLLGGAFCVGLAVWLHAAQPAGTGAHLALWALLAAVGVTLGGGGLALTLVDEAAAGPSPDEDFVRIPRAEWEAVVGGTVRQETRGTGVRELSEGEQPPVPSADPTLSAAGPAAAPYDPASVASMSAALLHAQPTTAGGEGLPATPPPLQGPGGPPPAPAAPPSGSSSQRVPPPAVGPGSRPTLRPPQPIPPAWQEDAIKELESVLEQFGKDASAASAAAVARPSPSIDRCIACGAVVSGYSEQACVVCDRPLCDRCLERSVADGHPSVCPLCPPPRES